MNVLLVVVDSLRADHLGCYGYPKNTSPNIDALARQSVVFERAFAPGIPTTPSFTTLLTGLHPYRHSVVAHGSEVLLNERVLLLPQLAQTAGHVTIAIDNMVAQGGGRGAWFSRGYDFYSGYIYQPFADQSEQLAGRALRYIEEFRDRPFFLMLHLWDAHTPYAPPAPFDTMHYEKSTPDGKLEEVRSIAPEYYDAFLSDMKLEKADDYDWIVAQYDGEISRADAQIARLIQRLETLGLEENTIVIVMSDHGECFGEGGLHFDHHGLYDATLRIPLIWRAPGIAPCRSQAFISTEDILPTLLESCGWSQPENSDSASTGRSFAPELRGGTIEPREFLVGVECTRQATLCLRTEKWKLMQPVVKNADGAAIPDFYGRARDEKPTLFDLESDPGEMRDVSDDNKAVRDELLEKLSRWRAREVTLSGGSDPILETPLGLPFDEFMARLQSRRLRS